MIGKAAMRPAFTQRANVLFEIPSLLHRLFASITSGITDVKLSLFSTYCITHDLPECEMSDATFRNFFDYIKGADLRHLANIIKTRQTQSFWAV